MATMVQADSFAGFTAEPNLVRRSLGQIVPVVTVLILLIAAWYVFAAYMNLQYLNQHMQDVDPTGWKRISLPHKIQQSLTTAQPIVPTPVQTVHDFVSRLNHRPNTDTGLWADLIWTGRAALLGFALGTAVGVLLAVLFISNRILVEALMPYVVASQTIPIVALVPAIMIVFGLNLRSEIFIAGYLAFFSVTISTFKGLQSVQPLAFELMRSYAANPLQTFLKLRLPAALPFVFTGLKIAVTASVVGAIIAELPSGSPHGLGQELVYASTSTDNITLWSTMLAASCMGLLLYSCVVLVERSIVRWQSGDGT